MPNPNNPFGFVGLKSGGSENRVEYFKKTAGVEIFKNQPLMLIAAGTVSPATAGVQILGISQEYKASASTDDIAVVVDPNAEFEVQTSGVFAAADVGLNADLVAAAGDSVLKQSNDQIDTATQAVTSTLQFKILGLVNRGENAVGANAIIRVKMNNCVYGAGTVGI